MRSTPSGATIRGFGSGGPSLAEVGERALVDRLVAIAAEMSEPGRAGSNGDDAAVWTPPAGRDLAVSVDALVEDVDFRRSWIAPRQLGRRAFVVAASDLSAMGAQPGQCVATVCARGSEQLDDILEIQRGLCEAAGGAGAAVVGGDVSAIDGPLVLDVCVTGTLPRGRALRRDAGRPGDALLVTGVLGRAAAGLRLLRDGGAGADAVERAWIEAQLEPSSRLLEGLQLLERGVGCAGDVSDGILLDAARTARASGCAAEIWAAHLPVDAELAPRFGRDWLELATGGGEDFELLAAVAEADAASLMAAWPGDLAPLTAVGRLCEGSGLRLLDRRGGSPMDAPPPRASHFS